MTLTVTIRYQGRTTPDVVTRAGRQPGLRDRSHARDADVPANVVGTFQVTDHGQDGTGQSYEQGFVHLVVTAPSGVTFNSRDLQPGHLGSSATRSGITGTARTPPWARPHLRDACGRVPSNVVDLYFPPVRRRGAGRAARTRPRCCCRCRCRATTRSTPRRSSGADWNLALLTKPLNSQAAPSPPTTEAQLRADLMSTSPEYDTINLPANQTIVITQPLEITHSVKIVGNGATLFSSRATRQPGRRPHRGPSTSATPAYTNIQVELDDFTIKFDMSQPIRWSNPTGDTPALWDPENNRGHLARRDRHAGFQLQRRTATC